MPQAALAMIPGLDGAYKIAVFLIMLSILVLLHEYGHFLLARRNGVRVNDFALGFGPTLAKWTSPRSGTNYRLNLLPLGGYCAMQGEDGRSQAEQQRDFRALPEATDDNFQGKSPWRRLSIVVAGPVANFIVAFAILAIGALAFGVQDNKLSTQIGPVTPGMPAAQAGLQIGDRIVAMNGKPVSDGQTMVETIRASAGKPLVLRIEHAGSDRDVTVTPVSRKLPDGKTVGQIGFQPIAQFRHVGPIDAVSQAGEEFAFLTTAIVKMLGQLVTDPGHTVQNLSGPVGIAAASGQIQDLGWGAYFLLAAQLSLSLGIFNLLPIPALDGGRGVFILAELLRGKPVDPEKEAFVHFAGFALLMALMVFVAYHDIVRIVSGKGVF